MLKLVTVTRIWDAAEHQAFTDLIYFKDAFFCCFRESDSHAGGHDGKIRILKSKDALAWSSVALLIKENIDLRDPKFSITPHNQLMLNMGGSQFKEDSYLGCSPHVAFSPDGTSWTHPKDLCMPNEWVWSTSWDEGAGYGISYRLTDPSDVDQPWALTLYKTDDGIAYTPIKQLPIPDYASEATIHFLPDHTMIAFLRGGKGWIGTAQPPYLYWNWNSAKSKLGGPNFVILPNGEMWGSSRLTKVINKKSETFTAVGPITLTSYTPQLILPSSGDTSYPGIVYLNGFLYISYYSSHEDKTNIYLAQIQLP